MKTVVSIVLNDFTHDSRVLKECRSLINAGYKVSVAALYSEGIAELEEIDGLEIHRLKISSQKLSSNIIFSGIKYLELLWKTYVKFKKINIYHCNDIEALPIGVFAKWMGKNKKVVYDAHEYESEKAGITGFRKKIILAFEKFFIKYADEVICVGNKIAIEYARLFNIPTPSVVMNCPVIIDKAYDESKLHNHFGIDKKQTILMVQGMLSQDRGIQETLDSFIDANREDFSLVFMGKGQMEEAIIQYAEKYSNIYFLPSVPPDEVLDYTSSADVGLTFIRNNWLSYYYSLPNKFFEYIHAELAIISWPLFEIKQIIDDNKIGVVTDDFSTASIAEAFKSLTKKDILSYKMKVMNLKNKYNWQQQEIVLLEVYNKLYT